jgi:hypothetical protein
MEAGGSSETLVTTYHTTPSHVHENGVIKRIVNLGTFRFVGCMENNGIIEVDGRTVEAEKI